MRTILQTLMRYKTSTILNIVGLSIAFAAFILLAMQIRYELSYNKQYKDHERIYVPGMVIEKAHPNQYYIGRGLAEALKKVPSIENIGVVQYHRPTTAKYNFGGTQHTAKCTLGLCDTTFFQVIEYDFIEGELNNFNGSDKAIISDVYAKKLFGEQPALNEPIHISSWNKTFTVGGVYKSMNSGNAIDKDVFLNAWGANLTSVTGNYYAYIKIMPNVSRETLEQQAKIASDDFWATSMPDTPKEKLYGIGFASLAETASEIEYRSHIIIYILMTIVFIILLVAFINFVNFAISMVPLKMKNINLRRVVGATKTQLRISMICTDIIIVIGAFILGICWVEFIVNSKFGELISDHSFENNINAYIGALAIAILMGVFAGLYPAFYSTSFQPSLMLKGRFTQGAKGMRMRKTLIGIQFFVAITFITLTIFASRQYSYMVNVDLGYPTAGIVRVEHISSRYKDFRNYAELRNQLIQNPQIIDATFGNCGVGEWGSYASLAMPNKKDPTNEDTFVMYTVSHIHWNFLSFFGFKILKGENFAEDRQGALVINKKMVDNQEYVLGQAIEVMKGTPMIGICENINLGSAHSDIQNSIFCYGTGKESRYEMHGMYETAYIKVAGNAIEIHDHIKKVYATLVPELDIEVKYLEEVIESNFVVERRGTIIMQSAAILSIIIALVGVFGLMAFDTRFRRKEISLRKINGATIKQIIQMFTVSYLKIVLIAFVISVPLVYYIVDKFLSNFSYKIAISWWVFALALALVTLLTLTIALIQCYKAASENPINSLKDE